jgi:integrase
VLRTAFKWAAGEGELISTSPFTRRGKRVSLRTPDLGLKRLSVTEEEHAALLAQAGRRKRGDFASLLRLLYDTGARPAEIYLARADEWDADRQAIVIDPADPSNVGRLKNRRHLLRKGRRRVIRLPDHLVPLMGQLRAEHPEGPLFRMENGRPWPSPGKIADRMKSLVETVNKLAARRGEPQAVRPGVSLYSYRHAYVTRFLRGGGKVMVLCELLNTSLEMLQAHYSHLMDKHDELLGAVNRLAQRAECVPHLRTLSPSGRGGTAS